MSGSTNSNIIGSGSDTIVLDLAADKSLGTDAEFTVSVDGKQVGGVQTATVSQWDGQTQAFTLKGDWAPGTHSVTVSLANNPNLSGQGSLYLDGLTYDGQTSSNTVIPIYQLHSTSVYGSTSIAVQDTTLVPAGSGATPGASSAATETPVAAATAVPASDNSATVSADSGSRDNSVGSGLNLNGYHLTFDWEANDFPNSPSPQAGSFTTTLSSGLRYLSNGDQQYWADSSTGQNPFQIDNGVLDINATSVGAGNTPGGGSSSYVSGLLTTQGSFSQQYGYFEMRAELPSGAGMWPAFWMLNDNSNQQGGWPPELDALETFGAPAADGEGGTNQAHWGIHSQNASQQAGAWATLNGNETTSFHTYGVLWTPKQMSFVYDGKVAATAPTPSDYAQKMYMIVNLAVGGTWPGYATGENATMKVDYLRAFSSDSAVPAVATQSISSPDGGGTSLYGASTAGGTTSALAVPQVAMPSTVT